MTFFFTLDIFRSSTCNIIVHSHPLIVLFATHWSHGLIVKPQLIRVFDSNSQNNSAACSVPFRAFWIKHTKLACLSCCASCIFCICSVQVLRWALLSCPQVACAPNLSYPASRRVPGMFGATTYLPSLEYMAHDTIITSNDTFGEIASSLLVYYHCGLPSAHPVAFNFLCLFSIINIRYLGAFCLSSCVSSSFLFGTICLSHM